MRLFRKLLTVILIVSLLCADLVSCGADDDTSLDQLQFFNLTWAVNTPLPEASDFVQYLPEGYTVKFAENYDFTKYGEYTLTLIISDRKGKETERTVTFTLVEDEEPPVISGARDIVAYLGDGVSYRSGVSVSDNCNNSVTLDINSSAVNTSVEGSYPVIYTAIDGAKNETTVTVTVYVYRETVTEDMLWTEIDRLVSANIPQNTTAEQKVRAVYNYVYYSISYVDSSDKSDWVRAAYEGIRTGHGDCYTYFALSKAFFVRLGIENKDIQRTEGIVTERHYWNMVNIGTSTSPRWYHFDACQLRGESAPFGCLLTDAQINAFSRQKTDANGVSNYFYAYNSAAYPATDTKIITSTSYD